MAQTNGLTKRQGGFTLIEIMVTLMIVAILIGIAMPNFLRAREVARANSCIKNLNTISIAKEQYAMENHLGAGASMPALSTLVGSGPLAYIKINPVCQSGGDYTLNNLGIDPVCSVGTGAGIPHVLP